MAPPRWPSPLATPEPREQYERLIGEVTQGSTVATAVAQGAEVFENTLIGQELGVSGVSIDEEVVRMMAFQRTYQAAARYIGESVSLSRIAA